jgi:stearoyl-CoA desaturase (delta-9 desaturase)
MRSLLQIPLKWVSSENNYNPEANYPNQVDWVRTIPFIFLNLACLLVFVVGFSWVAFITALVLYVVRIFFIGAFYHRYFSHKTYQTTRFWQFIFALVSGCCIQRGPLWWAAHHRQHHMCSDEPIDAHSPVHHGFWWSHMGWFMSKKHFHYNPDRVKDLARYPELVFLDRYDILMPTVLFISLFTAGLLLRMYLPEWGTGPGQMLVWGFCISTIALFHTTVTINSLSHVVGKKRFKTKDNSRNNIFLALLTLGEGWHNNHHHYPATARQGFMWWELDITYYMLKLMEKMGMIWDVRGVPKSVLQRDLVD